MADTFFKVKKGLNLPQNTSPDNNTGDISRAADDRPVYRDTSESNKIILADELVELSYSNAAMNASNAKAAFDELKAIQTDSSEATGFLNTTDSVITFTDSSPDRTLQIAPAVTSFSYYIKGQKFTKNSAQTVQIGSSEGLHYVYFNAGALSTTTTFSLDLFRLYALVAIVYWDATNSQYIYLGDERHGITMDWSTHAYLHQTVGAKFISGLALGDFTIGDGSLASHATFSCGNGVISDEDLQIAITDGSPQDLSSVLKLPVFYRDTTVWRKQAVSDYPVIQSGSGTARLNYNSAGTQVEVGEANYVLAHILATNDIDTPIVAIQGQAEYTSIALARTGANTEIKTLVTAGLPMAEFVFIGTIIYQTDKDYGNTINARIVTTDLGLNYVDWRQTVVSGQGVASDHGNLSGLNDDDHLQYALLAGRTGDVQLIDVINEKTSAAGVTVDGVLHKDGGIKTANNAEVELLSNTDKITSLKGSPSASASVDYILPVADGVNGQALTTNGSATLSWQTPGALKTVVSKSDNYTATSADQTILYTLTTTNKVLTLPTASGIAGKFYTIKLISTSTAILEIAADGSETIDGSLSFYLGASNNFITIESDGTNWVITAKNVYQVLSAVSTSTIASTSTADVWNNATGITITPIAGVWKLSYTASVQLVAGGSISAGTKRAQSALRYSTTTIVESLGNVAGYITSTSTDELFWTVSGNAIVTADGSTAYVVALRSEVASTDAFFRYSSSSSSFTAPDGNSVSLIAERVG